MGRLFEAKELLLQRISLTPSCSSIFGIIPPLVEIRLLDAECQARLCGLNVVSHMYTKLGKLCC